MTKIISFFLIAGIATGLICFNSCRSNSLSGNINKAVVTIDSKSVKHYSPSIFSGFIEHFNDQIYGGIFDPGSPLSDENGFRKDVIEAIKELKIKIVRWPGGCFASGYHWKNGVGKVRTPVPDPVWGIVEPNTFGTDEFIKWCRIVGCEPYICTNAGNGTPQEMKEWVEYCNGRKGKFAELRKANGNQDPYSVKYWSVGNENWGAHEIGASTPEKWGPLVRESSDLMLLADSSLILAAAATPDKNWTMPLLKVAGQKLKLIAVHGYWLPLWNKNVTPGYLDCITLSNKPGLELNAVLDILQNSGYRGKIKVAYDEWNLRGWHHPGFPRKEVIKQNDTVAINLINKREANKIPSQYNMADALFSASFLNSCLTHSEDVEMTNIAPLINTRGPLFVHPKGIVKRTTFHTLAMYANLLEPNVASLGISSDSLRYEKRAVSIVDAVATADSTRRRWSVALINRHPDKITACTLKIGDWLPDGKYNATILQGDSPDAYNDIENPERVKPQSVELLFKAGVVDLPAHSLCIVKIQR